jgi:NTP pyrophosphatase (non-canonical NTP hydrolase)
MNITQLIIDAHQNGVDKGWHEKQRELPELLCLIHSEVSEVLEEHRKGYHPRQIYHADSGKPEGIPIELADVVIRIADLCGLHNIDLEAAIREKMAYNKTRTYRHGNKIC